MRDCVERTYKAHLPLLEALAKSLEFETRDTLAGVPHIDRVSFRAKLPDSFLAKAFDPDNDPPYSEPLVEIEDQVAGRIIVFFLADLGIVREKLGHTFTNVEWSRRRPHRDEEFGYESEHIICKIPPHVVPAGWQTETDLPATFELQVRTIFMHAYAEPQHDIGYKAAKDLPGEIRRELAWIAASAWGADQAYERILKKLASKEDSLG